MLRGINVSGQKKILMKDLAAMYESLGFGDVRTYIQSGNVVFSDDQDSVEMLESKIKTAIDETFGFDVSVIVRTPGYFGQVIEENPLSESDTKRIYVTFLERIVPNEVPEPIKAGMASNDQLFMAGDKIYFHCPDGYGTTKLSNTFLERHLNVRATTRNWNSVNKLFALASQ